MYMCRKVEGGKGSLVDLQWSLRAAQVDVYMSSKFDMNMVRKGPVNCQSQYIAVWHIPYIPTYIPRATGVQHQRGHLLPLAPLSRHHTNHSS